MDASEEPKAAVDGHEDDGHEEAQQRLNTGTEVQQRLLTDKFSRSELGSARSRVFSTLTHIIFDTWAIEYAALALATGMLATIVVVLGTYNGQALRNWPYSFNANTVLSTLATVMRGGVLLAVAAALGQLKWSHFSRELRPLLDFQMFDDATRGPLGAFRLLCHRQIQLAGYLGALVVLLALFSDVAVQASASYPIRTVHQEGKASLPICTNYSQYSVSPLIAGYTWKELDLSMRAAIYSGLLQPISDATASHITPTCPTGNCSYTAYANLGICSECAERGQDVIFFSPQTSSIGPYQWSASIPSFGANMLNLTCAGNQTIIYENDTYIAMEAISPMGFVADAINGKYIVLALADILMYDPPSGDVYASRCTLSVCARSHEASVKAGVLIEAVSEPLSNVWHISKDATGLEETAYMNTNIADKAVNLSISANDVYDLSHYIGGYGDSGSGSLLTGSGSAMAKTADSEPSWNWTNEIFHAIYVNGPLNINRTFENLAQSMSNTMRLTTGEVVLGSAISQESYIHARWLYLLPATIMVVLAIVVVGLASSNQEIPPWKTSHLAAIIHAGRCVQEDVAANGSLETAHGLESLSQVSEMQEWAQGRYVRMRQQSLLGKSKTIKWHSQKFRTSHTI